MRHFLSSRMGFAVVFTLAAAAPAQDPPDRDETPPPPEVIEDIGYAADIVPGSAEFDLLPAAAQELLLANRDFRAAVIDGRVAAFYGAPLATGATAAEAEQAFWATHRDAFGVINLDLTVTRSHDVGLGKFRVFAYQQRIGGLPVEYAMGRVIVRTPTDDSADAIATVVYATGDYSSGDFPALDGGMLAPDDAVMSVAELPVFAGFGDFGPAELVMYAGTPAEFGPARFGPPALAWRFLGRNLAAPNREVATFFVDAATGELLHVHNEVHSQSVSGHLGAWVTPTAPNACWPDFQSRPSPVNVAFRDARVRVTGAGDPFGFTDDLGNYAITVSPPQSVSVSTGIGPTEIEGGRWVRVDNDAGSEPSYTQTGVLPPATVNFTFNSPPNGPSSPITALINVHQYASETHDFFASRTTWTGLDLQLAALANQSSVGAVEPGAWFSGTALNFTLGFDDPNPNPPDESFPNAAFAPIIAHEYGHFIVQQLGLSSGEAFGEGFGDCCAILQFEDPIEGRDWYGPDDHARNYSAGQPEKKFPCNDGIHECGKVLAGFWWDILEQYQGDLDPTTTPDSLRQLFVDWAQLTNGGTGNNAAHPLTAIEARVADDNDGNLSNGTPHQFQICTAAAKHNLTKNANCTPPVYVQTQVVAFRTPQVYLSSQNGLNGIDPLGIAVADFDLDGANDVALSCEGSNNVLFYFGQGSDSTFSLNQTPVTVALGGTAPGEIAIIASAGDPKHLVVTLTGSHQVQVVYNNGSRSFTALTPMASPVQNPVGVAVADWDQNGELDIAVAGWQQGPMNTQAALGLLWRETSGSYTQSAYQLSDDAGVGRGFALRLFSDAGNMNRLAMSNSVDRDVDRTYIFDYDHANPGNRTFASFAFVSVPGKSIAVGLLTGDALTDLAVSDLSASFSIFIPQFRWAKQNPPFQLANDLPDRVPYNQAMPEGIDAGLLSKPNSYPLQADPRPDAVITLLPSAADTVSEYSLFVYDSSGVEADLFRGPRQFIVTANPYLPPYPRRVFVTDINNDGFVDVITANRGSVAGDDGAEGLTLMLNKVY